MAKRTEFSRRGLIGAAAAATLLPAASARADTAVEIDAGVRAAIDELFATVPSGRTLYNRAVGVLIIPRLVKVGFIVGGSYGEGALISGGVTDSYWSYAAASIGYQIGAQATRLALFFMVPEAYRRFASGDGWEVGADLEVTVIEAGAQLGVDTTKDTQPVIALVYGAEGLLAGASVNGGKYTRIVR